MHSPDTIQQKALSTWYAPDHELHYNLLPSVMGLAGESGELLDLVKKINFKPGYTRDDNDLIDELGDVLYYVAILAHQLGITLNELSRLNHAKLTAREKNGTGYNRGNEKMTSFLQPGTQILYVPLHARGNESHPDVEAGFVTSHRGDVVFCRYWSKHHPDELRTKANSERTPLWCVKVKDTRPQGLVNALLAEL